MVYGIGFTFQHAGVRLPQLVPRHFCTFIRQLVHKYIQAALSVGICSAIAKTECWGLITLASQTLFQILTDHQFKVVCTYRNEVNFYIVHSVGTSAAIISEVIYAGCSSMVEQGSCKAQTRFDSDSQHKFTMNFLNFLKLN